jgi:hypothetical protein
MIYAAPLELWRLLNIDSTSISEPGLDLSWQVGQFGEALNE